MTLRKAAWAFALGGGVSILFALPLLCLALGAIVIQMEEGRYGTDLFEQAWSMLKKSALPNSIFAIVIGTIGGIVGLLIQRRADADLSGRQKGEWKWALVEGGLIAFVVGWPVFGIVYGFTDSAYRGWGSQDAWFLAIIMIIGLSPVGLLFAGWGGLMAFMTDRFSNRLRTRFDAMLLVPAALITTMMLTTIPARMGSDLVPTPEAVRVELGGKPERFYPQPLLFSSLAAGGLCGCLIGFLRFRKREHDQGEHPTLPSYLSPIILVGGLGLTTLVYWICWAATTFYQRRFDL